MLKKIFGSVTPVMLGLSLIFTGCKLEVPSNISVDQTAIPSIAGPSEVRAEAYPGVIQVSWSPANDAKSYDVYRRTYQNAWKEDTAATGGGYQEVGYEDKFLLNIPVGGDLFYNDIVSFTNQLRDGWEYEYTIVANSGQSTNRAINHDDLVLNAQSKSNRVKANIPDRTAAATKSVIPPKEVTVDHYEDLQYNNGSQVVVSWKKEPGAMYQLTYRYKGPNELENTLVYVSPAISNGLEPFGYYQFPSLTTKQFDKIEVRAVFPTDYYQPSAIVEGTIPVLTPRPAYTVDNLGFSAAPNYSTESIAGYAPYVEVTWNAQPDAATDKPYTLWRAETGNGSNIISTWTEVTAAQTPYYVTVGGSVVQKIRVQDTKALGVAEGKSYIYILVVTGANKGKFIEKDNVSIDYHASKGDAETFAQTNAAPNGINFALEEDTTVTTDGVKGVQISWKIIDNDLDVAYVLYRAPITPKDPLLSDTTSDNITPVPVWAKVADITNSNAQFRRSGSDYEAFYNDITSNTNLAKRNNYAYKVEAKKTINGTAVSAKPVIKILNLAPYVKYTELKITVPSQNSVYYPVNSNVLHISSDAYIKDISNANVEIFRRVIDGAAGTNFTKVASVSGTAIANGNTSVSANINGNFTTQYYEFIDTTGLTASYKYEYKAVLTISNATLPNKTRANITSSNLTPNHSADIYNVNFNPDGTTNRTVTVTVTNGANLHGSRLYYRVNSTNGTFTSYVALDRGTTNSKPDDSIQTRTFSIPVGSIPNGSTINSIDYGLTNAYGASSGTYFVVN